MNRTKTISLLVMTLLTCISSSLFAQKPKVNQSVKKSSVYQIEDKVIVPHTSIKDQARSGTCWCFAGVGMLEAELLKKYDKEFDLSEMFFVRWAYTKKFEKYIRMHGSVEFSPGGEIIDVLYGLQDAGMVSDEDYTGLVLGDDKHCHRELHDVLSEYAKVVIKKKNNGKISTVWPKMVQSILDTYLGEVPEKFKYNGEYYNAKSFAEKYPINIEDYVQLCAFTHKPVYKPFIMQIPDNWTNTLSYNMSLDELMNELDNALNKGYTVGWAQDVSDKGFSRNAGVGVVLEDDVYKIRQSDTKKYKNISDEEITANLYKFESVMPEKEVTEEMHQAAYDNWQTTDDHSMLIVGIAYDQNGTKYYKVKNSWGTNHIFEGYWYCSVPYVRLHTIFFTVNKDGITNDMKSKLGL